jgi:hypothetical protein
MGAAAAATIRSNRGTTALTQRVDAVILCGDGTRGPAGDRAVASAGSASGRGGRVKGFISFGALGALLLVAATASPAAAQSRYISESVNAAVDQAKAAGNYSGYGAPGNSFCILGGWLTQGQVLRYSMTLEEGKGYLVVGGADSDVKDLDLSVNDGTNNHEDTETDNTPWVHVQAESSTEVTITLTNYQGSGSPDFCCFIILEEGGAAGSHKALKEAATNLVTMTDRQIEKAPGFHTDNTPGPGSFCLFGGLFGTGGELGFHRPFVEGTYAVEGLGDKNAQDVDLKVEEDGTELVSDTDTDTYPLVNFTVPNDKRLTITMRMHASKGNSFAVGLILSNN